MAPWLLQRRWRSKKRVPSERKANYTSDFRWQIKRSASFLLFISEVIPFALCGRFTYSGMTLEKLLLAFIRDFHPLAHNFGVPIRSIMRFLDKKIENLFMAAR